MVETMIVAFAPDMVAAQHRGDSFVILACRPRRKFVGIWMHTPPGCAPRLYVTTTESVFPNPTNPAAHHHLPVVPLHPRDIFGDASTWTWAKRRLWHPGLVHRSLTPLRGVACAHCRLRAGTCLCGGCGLARYCSEECMRADAHAGHADEAWNS